MSAQLHDLHLLTGSYALDALPADEQAAFERHLDRCPSCTEEVRGLRETAARLGRATAVTPPPEMRARVLAAAPHIRQLPPVRGVAGRHGRPRRLPLRRAGLTTGILALAAAVAFLIVLQVTTTGRLHQAQTANQAIAAVLSAPDARTVNSPVKGGGTVTAVVSKTEHEAVVTSADLRLLSGQRVYQLWVIDAAGQARSAGLLTVTGAGSTQPTLASAVIPGDTLGITVEPSGGSKQPTSKPVAALPT